MSVSVLIAAVLLIMAIGYQMGRKRALKSVGGLSSMRNLHSLPSYYGSYVLLWAALPSVN
jgi:phosphate transport system permease protein